MLCVHNNLPYFQVLFMLQILKQILRQVWHQASLFSSARTHAHTHTYKQTMKRLTQNQENKSVQDNSHKKANILTQICEQIAGHEVLLLE